MSKKYTIPTDKDKNVKLTQPAKVAAGITAVSNALKDAASQMGMVRCNKTLLNLNQTKGFDCPSCAWPCLLYTSPSPRDATLSRMPSSA